jgi:hypothetical protein
VWERRVGRVSERQETSFFTVDKTPGPHQTAPSLPVPKMAEVARWAIQESPTLDLFEDCPAPDCQLGYCELGLE